MHIKTKQKSGVAPFSAKSAGKIYSVTELTELIKNKLEPEFSKIWLTGEISNFKVYSSGHAYFSIKDENAQIRAIMFFSVRQRVKFDIKDGLKVVASGRVSVYVKRGEYSVIVGHIEPVGKGALQLAFEQLKEKLAKEGLFDESRKSPISLFPKNIGVVTSPDGAAIRDILSILKKGFADVRILIYPVQVQGDEAKYNITEAIEYLNKNHGYLDVLLVGRGGGSLEDLWAFNEEIVARAISSSAIPVISCVGHEVDFTISDFVADLRAPTPSAAAEFIVKNRIELQSRLTELRSRFRSNLNYIIESLNQRIRTVLSSRVFLKPFMLIEQKIQRLDEISDRVINSVNHILEIKLRDFRILAEKANMLSPLNVLSRGYSITWRLPENIIVKNAGELATDDFMRTKVHTGELVSKVTEVKVGEKEKRA